MKRKPNYALLIIPSIGTLVWIIAFSAVILKGSQMINGDGDLGRHITIGNYILDNQDIPIRDVFSHTLPGDPLTPHEWLSEVLFAIAHRLLGLDGAIIMTASIIATSFWLVFQRSKKNRKSFVVLLCVGMLILLPSTIHWLSRPHIFTFLMLALWLIAIENIINNKVRYWWVLPVIMVVWVNLHGAFIAGFVIWLLYAIGLIWDRVWFKRDENDLLPNKFWHYFLVGGITSFLSSLINPVGFVLWKTSVGYVANKFMTDHIEDHASPNFHSPDLWPFLLFLLLLIVVVSLRDKKIHAEWLFSSVVWLGMALYSVRNIPLFVIVSAPMLAEGLEDLFLTYSEKRVGLSKLLQGDKNLAQINENSSGLAWIVIVIVLVVTGLSAGIKMDKEQIGNTYDPSKFPVSAVSWLKENPQEGEIFNYFPWGGYILYQHWPELRVFIDGQTDFYGEELTREYLAVASVNPDWEEILQKYGVDWVIFPVNEPLSDTIRQDESWFIVYEDTTSLIARRK